jgi:hypothetical protein
LNHGSSNWVAVGEEEGGQVLINLAVLSEVKGSLFAVMQDFVAENRVCFTKVLASKLVQQHPLDVQE